MPNRINWKRLIFKYRISKSNNFSNFEIEKFLNLILVQCLQFRSKAFFNSRIFKFITTHYKPVFC